MAPLVNHRIRLVLRLRSSIVFRYSRVRAYTQTPETAKDLESDHMREKQRKLYSVARLLMHIYRGLARVGVRT